LPRGRKRRRRRRPSKAFLNWLIDRANLPLPLDFIAHSLVERDMQKSLEKAFYYYVVRGEARRRSKPPRKARKAIRG